NGTYRPPDVRPRAAAAPGGPGPPRSPAPGLLSPVTPPPPPRSTLFPYTTLFRSISTGVRVWCTIGIAFKRNSGYSDDRTCGEPIDRKSTRLNSSHRTISYAGFRLKKKTLHAQRRTQTRVGHGIAGLQRQRPAVPG